jgi:methionyl-tRNA formyltransferase
MAKIVFMGTPDFAVPSLEALIKHHDVIGVVTQPDRPAGRKGKLKPPPVKVVAENAGIPVMQPERLRRKASIAELEAWAHADLFVVAAFGQILPRTVLDMPPYGCINVHGSLLPRWRGASPIQAAIREGDDETGITIMLMDEGLDTGNMLTKRAIPIANNDTGQSMHDKLAIIGAELLIETLPAYLDGKIQPESQDDAYATYAPQIKKEDGNIDWRSSAQSIERLVRAYAPWPSTYTYWGDKMLKIHAGSWVEGRAHVGKVITYADGVGIGTGDGVFLPKSVQLAGKKRVDITDFLRGYPDVLGAVLLQDKPTS